MPYLALWKFKILYFPLNDFISSLLIPVFPLFEKHNPHTIIIWMNITAARTPITISKVVLFVSQSCSSERKVRLYPAAGKIKLKASKITVEQRPGTMLEQRPGTML